MTLQTIIENLDLENVTSVHITKSFDNQIRFSIEQEKNGLSTTNVFKVDNTEPVTINRNGSNIKLTF